MPLLNDEASGAGVSLDGFPCVTPRSVLEFYARSGQTNPINLNAIGYVNPRGRWYGRGQVIVTYKVLKGLTNRASATHTLRFEDDYASPVTIQKLAIVRAKALTGVQGEEDDTSIYLLDLADQRYFGRYTSLNKAYNVRSFRVIDESNQPKYYKDTLNGGSPWSWSDLVKDIWSYLPTALFGTLTEEGDYPTKEPDNFVFRGVTAWDALMSVLDVSGNTIVRSLTGTFKVVSSNGDQPVNEMETDIIRKRTYNPSNDSFPACVYPEKVRVYFPADYMAFQNYSDDEVVAGQDAYRLKPLYSRDIDYSTFLEDVPLHQNVVPGLILPLHAPRTARYDFAGVLLNSSELTTFAEQIATRYMAATTFDNSGVFRSLHTIYHGFYPSLAPGARTEAVAWHLGPQGSKTEVLLSPLEYHPGDKFGLIGSTMLDTYLHYESTDPPDLARNHEPTERFCVVELENDIECNGGVSTGKIEYGVAFGSSLSFLDSGIKHNVYNPAQVRYTKGQRVFVFWHWQAHRFVIIGPAPYAIYRAKLAEKLCPNQDAYLDAHPTNISCCSDVYESLTAKNPLDYAGPKGAIVYLVYDCTEGYLSILAIQHFTYTAVNENFVDTQGCIPELDEYGVPTGNLVAEGECKIKFNFRKFQMQTCWDEEERTLYTFQPVEVLTDWRVENYDLIGTYKPIFVACPCDPEDRVIHRGTACGYGSGSG